jgi:4'-phosphopantetheinyl transferase
MCASVRECYGSGKSDGRADHALRPLARPISLDIPDVDVWLIALDMSAADLERCSGLLSAEESVRAARFHFGRDRDRYIAGRGMLRIVLGRYLETPPAVIGLATQPHGKPVLEKAAKPHFNLAHTDELALLAVSNTCLTGVDIEKRGRKVDYEALARRFLSPPEYAQLELRAANERNDAFLSLWTCKEAVAKALGSGLRMPLDRIEISISPHAQPRLVALPHDDERSWSLHTIDAGLDYVATVALRPTNI